jgi:hypothetical protein
MTGEGGDTLLVLLRVTRIVPGSKASFLLSLFFPQFLLSPEPDLNLNLTPVLFRLRVQPEGGTSEEGAPWPSSSPEAQTEMETVHRPPAQPVLSTGNLHSLFSISCLNSFIHSITLYQIWRWNILPKNLVGRLDRNTISIGKTLNLVPINLIILVSLR